MILTQQQIVEYLDNRIIECLQKANRSVGSKGMTVDDICEELVELTDCHFADKNDHALIKARLHRLMDCSRVHFEPRFNLWFLITTNTTTRRFVSHESIQ